MRKPKKDKTQKAIDAKTRVVNKLRNKLVEIRFGCDVQCEKINRRLQREIYLLEGLKSGALKP